MKLQQLRYALEIYRQNLNISAAAETLFTSQPGVSKQIRLLEEELNIPIFVRQGKRIISVTEPGLVVLEIAEKILGEIQNIKKISDDFSSKNTGKLRIAVTHLQAHHRLPEIVQQFLATFPAVQISIETVTPQIICDMVGHNDTDIGITTELSDMQSHLCYIPYNTCDYYLVTPPKHPLNHKKNITLEDISQYTLICHDTCNQVTLKKHFEQASLKPQISLSTSDSDLIRNYVQIGMGLGLLICQKNHPSIQDNLYFHNLNQLFTPLTTYIILHRNHYLRHFIFDFIMLLKPDLTRDKINHFLYIDVQEDYSI